MRTWSTRVALALVLLTASGCLSQITKETAERMGRGPRATEVYFARAVSASGRRPSFDEKRMWEDRLDDRLTRYRREHPELEQTPRYSDVRFWKQVSEGATRDEVKALLEDPDEQTIDPAMMGALAEAHWSSIGAKAREAWVYPLGWVIFFDDTGAVDFIRRSWAPGNTTD